MKTITIEFNQHEFEVEYIIDKEMKVGISINAIKLNDVDFYWDLSQDAISDIKKIVFDALK